MVQAAVNTLWKQEGSRNLEKVVVRLKQDGSLEEVDRGKAITRDKMQLTKSPLVGILN